MLLMNGCHFSGTSGEGGLSLRLLVLAPQWVTLYSFMAACTDIDLAGGGGERERERERDPTIISVCDISFVRSPTLLSSLVALHLHWMHQNGPSCSRYGFE